MATADENNVWLAVIDLAKMWCPPDPGGNGGGDVISLRPIFFNGGNNGDDSDPFSHFRLSDDGIIALDTEDTSFFLRVNDKRGLVTSGALMISAFSSQETAANWAHSEYERFKAGLMVNISGYSSCY